MVKIFMGLHLTSPIPSPHTLAQKPSTPPRFSVGVSPIHIQHMPPQTLVSRGCSPVPIFNLLPPNLVSLFNDTQMQTTQGLLVHSATRLVDPDIVSVTSSKSDNEGPSLKDTTRAHSLDIVPETQVVNGFMVDCMVHPCLLIFYNLLTWFPDGSDVVDGTQVEEQEGVYGPGLIIHCRYKHVFP